MSTVYVCTVVQLPDPSDPHIEFPTITAYDSLGAAKTAAHKHADGLVREGAASGFDATFDDEHGLSLISPDGDIRVVVATCQVQKLEEAPDPELVGWEPNSDEYPDHWHKKVNDRFTLSVWALPHRADEVHWEIWDRESSDPDEPIKQGGHDSASLLWAKKKAHAVLSRHVLEEYTRVAGGTDASPG